MEEAERARGAARNAVADVSPPALRRVIEDRLASASMVPGVLTILSARALSRGDADLPADLDDRAAGVQLVYEGLRLTRDLVADEPWREHADATDLPADLDVVAADVLVARGFRLLAETDASAAAVEVVRAFGREHTDGDHATLETTVFELAAEAGATATGRTPPLGLTQYAAGLARTTSTPLPAAADTIPDSATDAMRRTIAPTDAAKPSATDP